MRRVLAAWSAAMLLADEARAESGWSLQLSLGAPLNFPVPLTIRQSGVPVADGRAEVPTVSLHARAGLGAGPAD